MENKNWNIGDSIKCQQLTAKYVDQTIALLETAYYPYENICKTIGLGEDKEALVELRQLTKAAMNKGVSVIALDTKTDKVIGAAINRIQVKDDTFFEDMARSWEQPRILAGLQIIYEIDSLCDLFEKCQIDCAMDLLFLGTSPDYRRKGIGKKLTEISIEIGQKLARCKNVKKSIDGSELSLEPTPKIISSIFTSCYTQKIGRTLDFEIVGEKPFCELEFDGKKFPEVFEGGIRTITLEYKSLL